MTPVQMRTAYRRMDRKALATTPFATELKQMADDSADFSDDEIAALYADNFALVYQALKAKYPHALGLDAALPKRKRTPAERQKTDKVKSSGQGLKQARQSKKTDTASFVERMRVARLARQAAKKEPVTPAPKAQKQAKSPKTPKTAKTAKLTASDQAYLAANKVKALPVEVKHFRKYVKLAANGTKEGLIEALSALQRDITKGLIGKKTPASDVIMKVQVEYIDLLNGRAPYRPGKYLELVTKLGEAVKVYKTTEIMLAVVGWNEADKTDAQCKKLLATILAAKRKGKIKPGDPYAAEVDKLQRMLELATSGQRFEAGRVDLAGLRGLAGLAGLPGVKPVAQLPFVERMMVAKVAKKDRLAALSGLGDLPVALPASTPVVTRDCKPVPARPVAMSSMDMMRLNYETYPFKGDWLGLIGQPSKAFKIMVWGEPGMGKSTLVMKLARYLASTFGPVLYCSSEEFPSYTLNEKVRRVGGAVPGWDFSKTLSVLEPRHKFLVLDSLNHFGWTLADYHKLVAQRPDLSIIMIMQATKAGTFKGGKDIEHEVDTVIHAYAPGQARTTKNRFAPLSDITTF